VGIKFNNIIENIKVQQEDKTHAQGTYRKIEIDYFGLCEIEGIFGLEGGLILYKM